MSPDSSTTVRINADASMISQLGRKLNEFYKHGRSCRRNVWHSLNSEPNMQNACMNKKSRAQLQYNHARTVNPQVKKLMRRMSNTT
jgi:hypothetical protein